MTQLNYLKKLAAKEYVGLKPGLTRIKKVLEALAKPQDKFPIIHIAGTNGKGSVAAMINSVLVQAGFKVGLYTSPHLLDYRERIRINNQLISPTNFAKHLAAIFAAPGFNELTYFEVMTALAFNYFAAANVDLVVCEVGLGGRFDATNVVKNVLVEIITSIDFDHQEYLGKTLAKIASEKAGIIKRQVPIVAYTGHQVADRVVRTAARQKQSPLFFLDHNFCARSTATDWQRGRQTFSYDGMLHVFDDLSLKLLGAYQIHNVALAIAALELIRDRFFWGTSALWKGLRTVSWPGRLEIKSWRLPQDFGGRKITAIIDGAHNVAGAEVFRRTLLSSPYAKSKIVLVSTILRDKDYRKIILLLSKLVKKVIIFPSASVRALVPEILRQEWEKYLQPQQIITIKNFSEFGKYLAKGDSVVAITGSLYAVMEAIKYEKKYLALD